jgi:hypothetical protein
MVGDSAPCPSAIIELHLLAEKAALHLVRKPVNDRIEDEFHAIGDAEPRVDSIHVFFYCFSRDLTVVFTAWDILGSPVTNHELATRTLKAVSPHACGSSAP